ncbi:hypothetical protein A3Q56_01305 [Intoshia linei]|uniref:6-pyruvoyltetrahydropterin synthase n=1 Tax=Intoshia linei TaxID=1819745 RepID=A0A177B9B6_9BILA|nr:hypothetical protein A3Q56_01305 [Intoshia linei]
MHMVGYGGCGMVGPTMKMKIPLESVFLNTDIITNVKESGLLVNFKDIDNIIENNILNIFDHKDLDEIQFFKLKPSSVENIAITCWELIQRDFNELLYCIKVDETNRNSAIYYG